MCRYSDVIYKTKYVYFDCRKAFKQYKESRRSNHLCPECNSSMVNLGRDFKVPRQRDIKQWKKVELLYGCGIIFDSCGCGGPGYRPKTLRQAKIWANDIREQKYELEIEKYRDRNRRK